MSVLPLNALQCAAELMRVQDSRAIGGLARQYSGHFLLTHRPDVPFGWTMRKEPGYDAQLLVPTWLAWTLDLWEARWAVFPLLMQLGLWKVREPGGLYVKGGLTAPRWWRAFWWCFLNDADRAPQRITFTTNEQRRAFARWLDKEAARLRERWTVRREYDDEGQLLSEHVRPPGYYTRGTS